MREGIGIRIRQGFGAHEKSLHPNCFWSSITGANLAMLLPLSKMAANQSSRNRDVITALHHPTLGGQSSYLEWVVIAGQGGLTSSRAQGGVVGVFWCHRAVSDVIGGGVSGVSGPCHHAVSVRCSAVMRCPMSLCAVSNVIITVPLAFAWDLRLSVGPLGLGFTSTRCLGLNVGP